MTKDNSEIGRILTRIKYKYEKEKSPEKRMRSAALAGIAIFELMDNKAALRAPAAVPQEVVDILDQIRKSGFASYDGEKPHVLAVKALALLQQKGGE